MTLLGGSGGQRTALTKLGDLGRPGNAFQIAVDKLGLGRIADLAASNDVQEHLAGVEPGREWPGEHLAKLS